MQEVKFRVSDLLSYEKLVLSLGGSLSLDAFATDYYFNPPKNLAVVKLVAMDPSSELVELRRNNAGGFDYVSKENIIDADHKIEELTQEYGLKKILKKHKKEFNIGSNTVSLLTIEGIGEFVIIFYEAEYPHHLISDLKLRNAEQIKIPFAEL